MIQGNICVKSLARWDNDLSANGFGHARCNGRAAEQGVAGFSLDLVTSLQQQVHGISGFGVFDVISVSVSH